MPIDRHQLEDEFLQPMLDHLVPGSLLSGGGTYLANDGGPLASDFQLELPTAALPDALETVAATLTNHGTARGSYLQYGDQRLPVGNDELVLLCAGEPWVESAELNRLVTAVQTDALKDGAVGWHEGAFPDGSGQTVLVLSGHSAELILSALRAELVNHPAFPQAKLRSISPGAAESDPLS